MATVRNFDVVGGKFNVVGNCISGNNVQKLMSNL